MRRSLPMTVSPYRLLARLGAIALFAILGAAMLRPGTAVALDDGITTTQTIPTGSYIVNMGGGASPTVANSLKPYGFVYDVVVNDKVPVLWSINPAKARDAKDFSSGGTDYKGGTFVITAPYVTPALVTKITTAKTTGLLIDGPTTSPVAGVPVYDTITSFPKAVVDATAPATTSIITGYFNNAGIPASQYRIGLPSTLNTCDDVLFIPHADPTWATHGILKTWVTNQKGYVWAECHAAGVLDSVDDPTTPAPRDLNFLSANGTIPFKTHSNPVPPFSYAQAGDPAMQFIGKLDNAVLNGSEEVYLPINNWRPTTAVGVWDPDYVNSLGGGQPVGKAAIVAYGRGYGDPNAGRVMYEGGHNLAFSTTVADNVAAQRGVLNFLLLGGIDRRPEITHNVPEAIAPSSSAPLSASVNGGVGPYTYTWTSSCGGTFSPSPNVQSPTFTAPAATGNCIVRVAVADSCGRRSFAAPVVVIAAVPAAVPDSRVTGQDVTISLDPAANDTPGGAPLDATSVRLLNPITGLPMTLPLVVPGEGIYTTNLLTGQVTFNPDPGFVGIATPIAYQILDTDGVVALSTITITVTAGPIAVADDATTLQDANVVVTPLANDTVSGPALDPTSVRLLDPATGTFATGLTVFGEGTYTVDIVTGAVTFDPDPTFLGQTTPVTYRVRDANAAVATATITITVNPIPLAQDDFRVTPFGTPVELPVVANDVAGASSAPLTPGTVSLLDASDSTYKTSVTVAGEGTFVVAPVTGVVTFTPAAGYFGTTTALTYRIADANGSTALAQITILVTPPPTLNPDNAATQQNIDVVLDPLANDAIGSAPINPTTVMLLDPADTAYKTAVAIPGEGTYTVDSGSGQVTFDPEPSFRGTTTPITYRVADTDGATGTALITIVVDPLVPTALTDAASTPHDVTVTVAVLANDATDPLGPPLDPATVALLDPADGVFKSTVIVPGKGTFSVNPTTGAVDFDPLPGFAGTTPPLTYRVADGNGTEATATITVAVAPPPLANPDLASTPQNVDVSLAPLANDVVGASQFDPASLMLLDPADATYKQTVTILGEGAYAVDSVAGTVTFDPVSPFTGAATPVIYRVTDADGLNATATVSVVVIPVIPDAVNDAGSTKIGTPIVTDVIANDLPGAPGAPLDPTSVQLRDPADGTFGTSLVVGGEGTYTADPVTGEVTFTPTGSFVGIATPVVYRVADANGTTATASIAIVVVPSPIAAPDTETTPQNVDVTVDPLANDTIGVAPLDPTTVLLVDPADSIAKGAVAIAAEGAYTVDPVSGAVTFNPLPTFTGIATPITYRVADGNADTAQSTITITVTAVTPVATDDTESTAFGVSKNVDVLANDAAGAPGVPIDPTSVQLLDPADAVYKTAVTTPEGTFAANPTTGIVTFTPAAGFSGLTTSLGYRLRDANGTAAAANIVVTVAPDPVANPDVVSTPQNVPVDLDPIANDTIGNAPFDPSTILIEDPADSVFKDTVTIAGEGTYSVDPGTGLITLTPVSTYTGVRDLAYQVTDGDGLTRAGTATFTVTPITPSASNDIATTPFGIAVVVNVSGNDAGGAASAPLDPTSVQLLDPADSTYKTTVTVTGEGQYTVDAVTGEVTYTPAPGYTATTTPLGYRIADTNGTTATATITITVTPPPAASPDADTTGQNVTITIDPLTNDTPGGAPLDPTTVQLIDPADNTAKSSITIPAEGTYTVDPATGAVTFDPLPAFTGTATPITYTITDGDTLTATSTITITVAPVVPLANPDAATTPFGIPVTVDLPANDAAGATSAPLDPTTVLLKDPADDIFTDTVTLNGLGTFVLDASTGRVTFTPVAGYAGTTPPITYQLADGNGTIVTSTVTITVTPPPDALDDSATTLQNVPVTVRPLANDLIGGSPFDPASVRLLDGATPVTALTVPSEGTWNVNAVTGTITFTPLVAFTGTATPVRYAVTDTHGLETDASITVMVTPVAPEAVDDVGTSVDHADVVLDSLANDTGNPSAPLDAGSLVLLDPADSQPRPEITVAGQGVWTVTGRSITFRPALDFKGIATVRYRVANTNGTPASANEIVSVQGDPRLTVGIRANRRAVVPGKRVVFTVTLRNLGDATARDASVCFVPAPGFTFRAARQFGSGRLRHGQYCWTVAQLAPGRSIKLRVAGAFVNGTPRTTLGTARLRRLGASPATAVTPVRILARAGVGSEPKVAG
jgi:CshA-type fibril repeat protein